MQRPPFSNITNSSRVTATSTLADRKRAREKLDTTVDATASRTTTTRTAAAGVTARSTLVARRTGTTASTSASSRLNTSAALSRSVIGTSRSATRPTLTATTRSRPAAATTASRSGAGVEPPAKKSRPGWDIKGKFEDLEEFTKRLSAQLEMATQKIDTLNTQVQERECKCMAPFSPKSPRSIRSPFPCDQ
jgi:hypothetical protein